MISVPRHYSKKGSVIIVVICIFVALLILLASFFKSATGKVYTTKKLGDTMLARELANSLAILSNHYIKSIELKNSGSEIRKLLSKSIDKMESGEGKIKEEDLKKYFGEIYSTLINKSGLNKIALKELKWIINKKDFIALKTDGKDSPYPREKKGYIRYYMKISYLVPGNKSPITEEYTFFSGITVVANIIPVLSKFSFYVENVFNNRSIDDNLVLSTYFNVVDSTEGGILNDNSPRPWVINNGGTQSYDNYKDYVADSRGFIYLGGGTNDKPIILGIARGFSSATQGDFGEDFHFYKNGRAGYWKLREVWPKTESNILESEIGLCNDVTSNYKKWQEKFGSAGYDKISRYNSIFRLYGTDVDKSPTLVYGYVNSMHGSVKAFKSATSGSNYLYYIEKDNELDFINSAGYNDNPDDFVNVYDLKAFGGKYLDEFGDQATFEIYNEKYSTKITQSRYNKDFTYYLAKEKGKSASDQQYPLKYCTDLLKGDLIKLCEDASDDSLFLAVPNAEGSAEFRNIYSNSTNLEELDKFLDGEKLGFENTSETSRIAYYFKPDNSEDIEKYLINKGLLKKKDLSLDGWLYIDCDEGFEVVLKDLNLLSHGGIIVSNGNVTLKGNIKSVSGAHLNIVALKGNITIERSVDTVDASLIAGGGQVKLDGNEKDKKLNIKGNIVMKNIPCDNIKNRVDYEKMKRGLFLNYNTDLSAIPFSNKYNVEESKTELPLLMFNINEKTKMLD